MDETDIEADAIETTASPLDTQLLALLGFVERQKPKPIPQRPIEVKAVKVKGHNGGSMGRIPLPADALRRSQLRILAVLLDAEATSGSSSLSVDQIVKGSKVSYQSVKQGLGAARPHLRQQHDQTYGYRSLLTRGIVAAVDAGGEQRYYLSPLGQYRVDELEDEIRVIKATPPNDAGLALRGGTIAPKIIRKKRAAKRTKNETVIETE